MTTSKLRAIDPGTSTEIDTAHAPAAPQGSDDEGVPVSVRIRERIQAAQQRFHANDNIAEFIEPGELEKLLDEVQGKLSG